MFGWLFEESKKPSRPTSKKVRKNVRLNVNKKSVSVTAGGRNNRVTVGRRGVRASLFGIRIW